MGELFFFTLKHIFNDIDLWNRESVMSSMNILEVKYILHKVFGIKPHRKK